jgi:hypothetical protein
MTALAAALRAWQQEAGERIGDGSNADRRRRLNATLRQIARLLVPLNYARGERFDHDPALKFGVVPRLEAAATVAHASPEMKPFVKVGLQREINKVRATLRAVHRLLR